MANVQQHSTGCSDRKILSGEDGLCPLHNLYVLVAHDILLSYSALFTIDVQALDVVCG